MQTDEAHLNGKSQEPELIYQRGLSTSRFEKASDGRNNTTSTRLHKFTLTNGAKMKSHC